MVGARAEAQRPLAPLGVGVADDDGGSPARARQRGQELPLHAAAEDDHGRRPARRRIAPRCAPRRPAARPSRASSGGEPLGQGQQVASPRCGAGTRSRSANAPGQVDEVLAQARPPAAAEEALAAGGGVGHHHAIARPHPSTPGAERGDRPAASWPNGAGGGGSAGWRPLRSILASVAQVSADSTSSTTSPGPGHRIGHLLQPEVAGTVEDQRAHRPSYQRTEPVVRTPPAHARRCPTACALHPCAPTSRAETISRTPAGDGRRVPPGPRLRRPRTRPRPSTPRAPAPSSRRCATRCWPAASASAACWRSRRCEGLGDDPGAPPADRRGDRADPHLLAHPRRPARDGRRRPAPRAARPATGCSARTSRSSPATRCSPRPCAWSCERQDGGPAVQVGIIAELSRATGRERHGGRPVPRPARRRARRRRPRCGACTRSRPAG